MLNKQSDRIKNSQGNSNYQENSNVHFSSANYLTKAVCSPDCALDLEQIIDTLENQFLEVYNRPMIAVETLLLEGIWQSKTYSEIAVENHYSSTYLTNVAAPKLLKKLSQLAKCRITKKNCRSKLEKCISENTSFKSVDYGRQRKTNRPKLNKISGNSYSYKQDRVFDLNSFLSDAVLFAQII